MLKQLKKWLGFEKQEKTQVMPPSEQGQWEVPHEAYLSFPKSTHYHIPVRTEAEARFFASQKGAATRKTVKTHLRWFGPGQGMLFMEKAPPTPDDLVKGSWGKFESLRDVVDRDGWNGESEPVETPLVEQKPDESTIRQAAYYKWINARCPEGQCERFWFEAERELNSEPTSGDQIRCVSTPAKFIRAGEKLLKEKKGE